MRKVDRLGKRYGRLLVVSESTKRGRVAWQCLCDCGNQLVVPSSDLQCGNTRSCGCLRREEASHRMTTHGLSSTPIYAVWGTMLGRCSRPSHNRYHLYGGKGIKVCPEWHQFENFFAWASTHGYRRGLTIDRIDNSKGYGPANCRVVDFQTQARNTSNNRIISAFNKSQCLSAWAEDTGITREAIAQRLKAGWEEEKALTLPSRR